jgi:ATP adenylyltransferase
VALERFAASWREAYVTSPEASANARDEGACVFCTFADMGVSISSGVVWMNDNAFIILNAFPYGSGHLLALPRRHVASVSDLSDAEYAALAFAQRRMVQALEIAYAPNGMNIGMNMGQAAGAGIPKHLHVHALPRWNGDTNFMTTIGETRVLPESLQSTWEKVSAALATLAPTDPSVD